MKTKILKPLTPQKRMDVLNELVVLLKPLRPPEHARGIELIARLAADAGIRNGKKLMSKGRRHVMVPKSRKGANHANNTPESK